MKIQNQEKQLLLKVRILTPFFIGALVVSGLTAFPPEPELKIISAILGISPDTAVESYRGFQHWVALVYEGIRNTNESYPFLAYGTDWLGFAHIMIAAAFIGLCTNPVQNKWIIYRAMFMCICIIPTALICGAIRQVPFYWQLIDCSFGIFGLIPLYLLHKYVGKLEKMNSSVSTGLYTT